MSSLRSNTNRLAYDVFAGVYNDYWSSAYARQVISILERVLLSTLPLPARIVDICCGCGHVADLLSKLGFETLGVDFSMRMLMKARQNAPHATFIQADITESLPLVGCDAAVCLFDSLNHMSDMPALISAVRGISCVLRPRGRFVGDIYMNFANHRDQGTMRLSNGCVIKHSYSFNCRERLGTHRYVISEPLVTQQQEILIIERAHDETEMINALESSGFEHVKVCDASVLNPSSRPGHRLFITATKI